LAAASGECYTPRCDVATRRRQPGGRRAAPAACGGQDGVPTYDYACDRCQRTFEVRQRISEVPLTTCMHCGGPVHRLLAPAPFILKGSGWYVSDYPSEARKKGLEAEKKATEPTTAGAGATSSGVSAPTSTGGSTPSPSPSAPTPSTPS
jgi:putative FmdB family regulatory protein